MKKIALLVLLAFLLTGCVSREPQNQPETQILVREGAYTLSDGTRVDEWITDVFENTVYKTADGWELLWIPPRVDIANVGVVGLEGFQHLSETAQKNVRAYYDENMPELDVPGLLEEAWQDCNTVTPEKGMFGLWWAHQDIFPVAYNETIMCFAAETSIVGSDNVARIERIHTIFRRDTGEVLEIWDLFTEPPEAAKAVLAHALAKGNNLKYDELRAALDGDNVVRLCQGGLEFYFPAGTLSWSEYDNYMDLDCDALEIWQDWAITERIE